MTERERWIVYPLLFLALGAALRDKFSGPEKFDATNIRCEEIHATKLVIADPNNNQPRIVLDTVKARSKDVQPGVQSSGQIELFDGAQQIHTAITHGAVITHGLKTKTIAVVDPAGRTRVQIGARLEGAAQPQIKVPDTSGVVELFGKDNLPLPIVRLAATPEGGYLFVRQNGLPVGVAVGNFPQGSGTYMQVGGTQYALRGPATPDQIKEWSKSLVPKDPSKTEKAESKRPEGANAIEKKPGGTVVEPKQENEQ